MFGSQKEVRVPKLERAKSPDLPDHVSINSSGLGVLNTCPRKAWFLYKKGMISKGGPAADFGSLIHLILKNWYLTPVMQRTPELILSFLKAEISRTGFVFTDPKRDEKAATQMLSGYAERFKDDCWEVAYHNGNPMVEMPFEGVIHEDPRLIVTYFGTIDLVVRNVVTGEHAVMDHKTSSQIGAEFLARWNPNHQMSGYIWALNNVFHVPCNLAIINGIQVLKTKSNEVRVETRRSAEDLMHFESQVTFAARAYQRLLSAENDEFQQIKHADGFTCSGMGGCQFLSICSTEASHQLTVMENGSPVTFGDGGFYA